MSKKKDKKDKSTRSAKSTKSTAQRVKKATVKLASNPVVSEVVAATLVAAAAALRNPKKARALAESAADEIGAASKEMAGKGGTMWKLAMDVARKSLDALGGDEEPAPKKKAVKKQGKKSK